MRSIAILNAICLTTPLLFASSLGSVNIVGYVNISLAPGLTLLANPLQGADPRLGAVFSSVSSLPQGSSITLLRDSQLLTARFDAGSKLWEPAEIAQLELLPGEGFFFHNPGQANLNVTFVGNVLQGTLTNALPKGLSLRASMVPQEADLEVLQFPSEPGDEVFLFDVATQRYVSYFFDDFDHRWIPSIPRLQVGQAFFLYKQTAAEWVRTFNAVPRLPELPDGAVVPLATLVE